MDAIDLLRHEHRQIDRLLEQIVEAIRVGRVSKGSVNPTFFERAAEFIHVYVEGAHHAKEQVLHREMIARGLPARSGLLRQLAEEHAFGHEASRSLHELADLARTEPAAVDALLDHAEAYVRLHQVHTELEERQLLPMAKRLLAPGEGLDRLWSKFAEVEAKYGSLAAAADALEAIFAASSTGSPLASRSDGRVS